MIFLKGGYEVDNDKNPPPKKKKVIEVKILTNQDINRYVCVSEYTIEG